MKKKLLLIGSMAVLGLTSLTGCGQKNTDSSVQDTASQVEESVLSSEETQGSEESSETPGAAENNSKAQESDTDAVEKNTQLEDGIYLAVFSTDSGMFHVNEAKGGRGVLTVKDGEMTIHVTLGSKKILNLYSGLKEDAQKEGAELLQPTLDVVTYEDGMTEEVFGFDIPVPYLDEEFDVALIGTKDVWYDHKVSVSDPVKEEAEQTTQNTTQEITLDEGEYFAEVTLTGGSGKATVQSPAVIHVENGEVFATITWSSKNYDYMLVNGEKYLNEAQAGEQSQFTIPVAGFDCEIPVVGDTIAMSTPHEVEYVITFKLVE